MNKETIITQAILLAILGTAIVFLVLSYETPEEKSKADIKELEFLKAFATYHVDESDPDWQCKKTIGIWELAKQDYPHFVENTKWLADKKCGFDVSEITP